MANPALPFDFLDQQRQRGRRPTSDPIAEAIGAIQVGEAHGTIVYGGDPDETAKVTKVAREVGAPPALIQDRVPEVLKAQRADRIKPLLYQYPVFTRWATDNPRSLVAASDDPGSLWRLGKALDDLSAMRDFRKTSASPFVMARAEPRFPMPGAAQWPGAIPQPTPAPSGPEQLRASSFLGRQAWRFSQVGADFTAGLARFGAALFGPVASIPDAPNVGGVYPLYGNLLPSMARLLTNDVEAAAPEYEHFASLPIEGNTTWEDVKGQGSVGTLGKWVVDQGPASMAQIPLLLNPEGIALYVSSLTGQIGQQRAKANGRDSANVADIAVAAPFALASAALDRWGLDHVIGASGSNVVTRVAKAAFAEAGTEALQSGIEYAGGTVGTDTGFDPYDALDQMAQGAILGGGMGGSIHGGIEAVQKVRDKVIAPLRDATQAEIGASIISRIGDAAVASKLRERDPVGFQELIRNLGEQSDVTHVFVPGAAMQSFMQSEDYDQLENPFATYAKEIAEAAAVGGDVVLPVEFALGALPGTKAWSALKDDMRLTPGGMSMREAAEVKDQVEKVVADLANETIDRQLAQQAEASAREKIVDRVRQQLQDAGFTPANASAQAELIAQRAATRAARAGRALTGDEFDTKVERPLPPELQAIKQADRLDVVIHAMRKGAPTEVQGGKSLLEWIAARGGIEDRGGNVAAMGGDKWHLRDKPIVKKGKDGKERKHTTIPGRRKLLKDFVEGQGSIIGGAYNPNSIESLFDAAISEGYFPDLLAMRENGDGYADKVDINDFLAAIGDELAGRPLFAEDAKVDGVRAAADELRQLLEEQGLNPDGMTDEEVRAAVARLSSFEQDAPIASLTGEEIAPLGTDVKTLRAAARKWYDENLRGKPVVSHPLGDREVQFGSSRKAFSASANPRKLQAFAAVRDIIADGTLIETTAPRDQSLEPSTIAYHYLEAVVEVAGQREIVGLTVREDTNGHLYYNHSIRESAARNPEDTASKAGPGEPGSAFNQSSTPDENFNLAIRSYNSGPKGRITFDRSTPGKAAATIQLFATADPSTLLHELGHDWLEELRFDAEQPGAAEGVARDWQVVQDWFAENGHPLTDGVIPTEAHELFARGVERYLMEGKSPSPALQRIFETLRSWMLTVYRTVRDLRSPITPEVRGVFDRLLATDEEIALHAESQAMHPLFRDAASAGMTGNEFAAYALQVEGARSEAHAELLAKTMAEIRRRETKRYADERRSIRAAEAERLDASPVLSAVRLMRENPVSKEWLVDRLGLDVLDLLPKRVPPLWTERGSNPDAIAEAAGFDSGQQMIEVLIGAERAHREAKEGGDGRSLRDRMIDQATDEEMSRRHGDDPLNDGSIEREAVAAVNNELAGERLATEVRILARKAGRRPTAYRIARDWARNRVRTGVVAQEASPGAMQRHTRAVAKAGREAEQALMRSDFEAALRHKQQQMLSSALLAEAKAAYDEVEAAHKRLDKIARRATMRSVDQDYLEQAHALLEMVDLKERSQKSIDRQQRWADFAAAREAEGFDIVVPASFAETIGRTHWSRLSVENLLGLDEAVKQVMHLGRLKQTLLDNQDEREWSAIFSEAVNSARNISGPEPRGVTEPGVWGSIRKGVLSADASLLKMETICDWLDGGNSNGVFNRVAFRPIAAAQAREQAMVKDYFGRIKALFEAVPAEVAGRWQDKMVLPFIDKFTAKPMVVKRHQVIAMALNVGNEGNLQRLADGYALNRDGLTSYLETTLTAEEWQFVQGVWDTIDTLWPEISAVERRVNGVAPEKVEPRSFSTPYGEMRGGYYPAIYNSALSYKAEEHGGSAANQLFEPYVTKATTRSAATKAREEKVERPILLDLGVINRHLGEVIHDMTHREAVINAWRLLNNDSVMRAVDDALGPEIRQSFRPWVKFVANSWAMERAGNEGIGKWIGRLRANATAVGLGFRATTMIAQLSGYANSIEVVGERYMAPAMARFAASPFETTRWVMERSDEVRHRMDTLDRDIRTELARLSATNPASKALARANDAKAFMFHGIGLMDRAVSVPTWMGAYDKAISEGMSEADAAYAGDKAVRLSQGAGGPKDLASIQRGTGRWGEALKLLTAFYSYQSAQYQRQRTLYRDATGRDVRRPRNLPRLAARAFWFILAAPVLTDLLKMAFGSGGPDDDEWWAQYVMRKLLANSIGPIPVARDLFEPAWNALIGSDSWNPSTTPVQRFADSLQASAADVGKIARGKDTTQATRHILETVGYATGLVPGQVAATTQFLVDLGYGDARPRDAGDWVEGMTTGRVQ